MYWRSSGLALMAPGGRPPLVRLPSVMAAGRDMPSLLMSVAGPSVDFSAVSDEDCALPMLIEPLAAACYGVTPGVASAGGLKVLTCGSSTRGTSRLSAHRLVCVTGLALPALQRARITTQVSDLILIWRALMV